jgi:RimJ/RimL family protein N-acetyltransferase
MTAAPALYPEAIEGDGLLLRPWDEGLVAQMAAWNVRGFPYHAFDMDHLRDPVRARSALARHRAPGPHRHFVACEGETAVGRVSVNLRDQAGIYFWGVHVPEEHGRRGVCRRMLEALIAWLEERYPLGNGFVLSTNAFATHAHRAYRAVGFEIDETRWHYDKQIADELWRVPQSQRAPISPFVRFHGGQWEVRIHIMRRPLVARA